MSVKTVSTLLLSMGVALGIAGCQSGTIFKRLNINDGTGYSLDARQRTILVKSGAGPHQDRDVVCAEPSPDAIAAQAATIAAQASGGRTGAAAAAGASSSLAESAASIGLRTQTITILRDVLFRACEGYMNGVVSKFEYNAIVLNMDKVIVSALATDGLAGTPVASTVAIGTETSGETESKAQGTAPIEGEGNEGAAPDAEGKTKSDAGSKDAKFDKVTVKGAAGGLNKESAEALTRIAINLQNQQRGPLLCVALLSEKRRIDEPLNPAVLNFCKDVFEIVRHKARHEINQIR